MQYDTQTGRKNNDWMWIISNNDIIEIIEINDNDKSKSMIQSINWSNPFALKELLKEAAISLIIIVDQEMVAFSRPQHNVTHTKSHVHVKSTS